MKRLAFVLALAVLIGAGAYCAYRYYQGAVLPEQQMSQAYDAQLELFARIRPAIPSARQTADSPTADTHPENPLQAAEQVNPDAVGWLTIPGTHIDYPVAQAQDNDFYLHHGFDGRENRELGCPFLDYRCEGDFGGFNSIVYAHHMTGQRMFADIALFREEAFLKAHQTGYLTTADGTREVCFFAYLNVPGTSPAYHAVFLTAQERQDYMDMLLDMAVYHTLDAAQIPEDPHLLLLSTCTFEFEEARGILVGVVQPAS
ncbi:MAG: class B sortase [Oscillospiraceae bacterium]|nr:class B sortase [Oscillospiraceae bacterium]